jgi:hypothetical protein
MLSRAVMISQLTVFYNDPNLINTGGAAVGHHGRRRSASRSNADDRNRSVVITNPKPAAWRRQRPKGGLR